MIRNINAKKRTGPNITATRHGDALHARFISGIHRYRTDKEYSKRVLEKYGEITDDGLLEGTWQGYVRRCRSSRVLL
ncbi:MAG: hypothetical protein ACREQ7_23600 [Candidatus Binatia bacterium]